MANSFYSSAGLVPYNLADTPPVHTVFYISAGFIPTDTSSGPIPPTPSKPGYSFVSPSGIPYLYLDINNRPFVFKNG
jgi:hypothetical protein